MFWKGLGLSFPHREGKLSGKENPYEENFQSRCCSCGGLERLTSTDWQACLIGSSFSKALADRTDLFCSTSLPPASTRWARSTFSSHCSLSSKQCCWLTLAKLTKKIPLKNVWECWESNSRQLGPEASMLLSPSLPHVEQFFESDFSRRPSDRGHFLKSDLKWISTKWHKKNQARNPPTFVSDLNDELVSSDVIKAAANMKRTIWKPKKFFGSHSTSIEDDRKPQKTKSRWAPSSTLMSPTSAASSTSPPSSRRHSSGFVLTDDENWGLPFLQIRNLGFNRSWWTTELFIRVDDIQGLRMQAGRKWATLETLLGFQLYPLFANHLIRRTSTGCQSFVNRPARVKSLPPDGGALGFKRT